MIGGLRCERASMVTQKTVQAAMQRQTRFLNARTRIARIRQSSPIGCSLPRKTVAVFPSGPSFRSRLKLVDHSALAMHYGRIIQGIHVSIGRQPTIMLLQPRGGKNFMVNVLMAHNFRKIFLDERNHISVLILYYNT